MQVHRNSYNDYFSGTVEKTTIGNVTAKGVRTEEDLIGSEDRNVPAGDWNLTRRRRIEGDIIG